MSLSAANQAKMCQILNVIPTELAGQINWLGTNLTTVMETAITDQITIWDAGAATDFTNIDPNIKNFGARINAGDQRAAIRRNIAVLLERPDWAGSNSRLVRG